MQAAERGSALGLYSLVVPTPRGADRLFLLGVALMGLLFAARAGLLLGFPHPVEYGEGTTWTYAHLLETRGAYFLPIHEPPYIHATYPPVFPWLQAALGGGIAAGRLVALAGSLLAALALGWILRGPDPSSPASGRTRPGRALAWGVVLLGTPAIHEWGAVCRVDTLALGFTLAGVAIATRLEAQRGELLALPCFVAAFFTKQVALAGPAGILLWLLLTRRFRRLVVFGLGYAGLVLSLFVALNLKTDGELWKHLVTYTGFLGIHPGPIVRFALRFGFAFPVLLGLGLRVLAPELRRPTGGYAVVALGSLVLSGKPGAAVNYLIEPGAAAVLLGGLAAERLRRELASDPERQKGLALLLAVQCLILIGPGRPVEFVDLWRAGRVEGRVVEAIRAAQGPVLSEDLGLVLAAGKEPELEPFQFGLLAQAGLFDPAPILAGIRARGYALVVFGERLRSLPGIEPALAEAGYLGGERLGPYTLLWPPGSRENQ